MQRATIFKQILNAVDKAHKVMRTIHKFFESSVVSEDDKKSKSQREFGAIGVPPG
jgi:glycyl-tRNA synthetase beta subunit